MTKKKQQARSKLRNTAKELSVEMHEGKWDHIPSLKSKPVEDLIEMFDELQRRCPGHTTEEYKETFLRSWWENR